MSKNAKFDGWAVSAGYLIAFDDQGRITSAFTESASEGWQAAIQSLEVTPMLKMLAYASFIHSTGRFENGLIDPLPEDMEFALNAFLNAIKEQAK